MFTFSEMLALVESESSFGAYVCHRRPAGLHSDQRSCLNKIMQMVPRLHGLVRLKAVSVRSHWACACFLGRPAGRDAHVRLFFITWDTSRFM